MPAHYEMNEASRRSVAVVERQLAAYNRRDLAAFLACYSDDVVVASLNGEVSERGKAALSKRYAEIFRTYPGNHAVVKNRIALGLTVIDHEDVTRGPGLERFEILAIYTLSGDKIVRVDFRKEQG